MGRWYVDEQSIHDEETAELIIEASEYYMGKELKMICVEHNEREIYYRFVTKLLDKLQEEVDKDGVCHMMVDEKEVTRLRELLPIDK